MKTMRIVAVAAMAGTAFAQDASQSPAEAWRLRLATLKVSVDFRETALEETVAYLAEVSGAPLVVDPNAVEAGAARVTLQARDLPVRTVLRLILSPRGLTVAWREGVLVVMTRAEAAPPMMRTYDVRDLMRRLEDFPGPDLELADKPGIRCDPDIFGEPPGTSGMSEQLIEELVRGSVGGRSWEEPGCGLRLVDGRLVVTQSAGVHREIAGLLARLRQYR